MAGAPLIARVLMALATWAALEQSTHSSLSGRALWSRMRNVSCS